MIIVTEARGDARWRREHRCRVSASDLRAALARRGSRTYEEFVARLVREFEGIGDPTEEYPDPWQEEHEAALRSALAAYRREFGVEVEPAGLCLHETMTWLAASPHGLVGERGIVHFRIRKKLRSFYQGRGRISEREMARLQATLLVCERTWADLVDFWDGRGEVPDRVARAPRVLLDRQWFSANVLPRLVTLWDDVSAARRASRAV